VSGATYRARVTAISGNSDQPFWIRASWPAVGGEHPDFIRPRLGLIHVMPKVGDFVDIEPIGTMPGKYQWSGIDRTGDDLPAEARAAYPTVAVFAPAHMRCYLVLDDRETDGGVATLHGTTIVLGAAASQFVALAGEVLDRLTKLQTAFDGHVHATAALGPPSIPTPNPAIGVPVGALASVAAERVKAE